jgi:RNA polymerase sporulation-specific sigma factor
VLENIKVDVIYYGTQKDFEMEFNLCGCCRMRLLTATADNLKSFLNCIKVAVARSRVILLFGELYGEAGLFNIISKAVSRDFEEVENPVYGIAGDSKTRLLKQSIPLVTSNGKLMGCVIEQGPQAIIMISDDKDGRKEIMQNLVHPYIKELSKSEGGIATDSVLETVANEPEISSAPEHEALDEPCEIEEEINKNGTQTEDLEQSLDEGNENEEELETVSLEDFATQNEADAFLDDTIADDLDLKMQSQKLHTYIPEVLDRRERQIICMRYGLGNQPPMTQQTVAEKLNISRSYVSRLEKRALEKLRARFERADRRRLRP